MLLLVAISVEIASLLLPASSVHYISIGSRRHFPVQNSPWIDHLWVVLRYGGIVALIGAVLFQSDTINTMTDLIAQESRNGEPGADRKNAGRGGAPVHMEESRHY